MIIQGSNQPIVIQFKDQPYVVKSFVSLHDDCNNCIKEWEFTSSDIHNNTIIANLTEEETLSFPVGIAVLEIKWVDRDNNIWNASKTKIRISDRNDERLLLSSDSETPSVEPDETIVTNNFFIIKTAREKIINSETGAVVYHGKSPYYDEELYSWMEWNDDEEKYVESPYRYEYKITEEDILKIEEHIVDDTLSIKGKAADAKKVGEMFDSQPKEISNVEINNVWKDIFGG